MLDTHFLSLCMCLSRLSTVTDGRDVCTYHIHGADTQIVMLGGFVVESTSGRHDNNASAGIDGERAVAVAVGDLKQQARDGSTLHLNHKSAAGGVFEHVRCVFALQESEKHEKKKNNNNNNNK